MILTKNELAIRLQNAAGDNHLFHPNFIYSKLLELLEWEDDDPRDITEYDISRLEDFIAVEIDQFLNKLEKLV